MLYSKGGDEEQVKPKLVAEINEKSRTEINEMDPMKQKIGSLKR
jgi:hypothetical protein